MTHTGDLYVTSCVAQARVATQDKFGIALGLQLGSFALNTWLSLFVLQHNLKQELYLHERGAEVA